MTPTRWVRTAASFMPVSTWLNAGIPPTDVAEWAGHSVDILLRIYVKCLDRGGAAMRARVEEALGLGRSAAG